MVLVGAAVAVTTALSGTATADPSQPAAVCDDTTCTTTYGLTGAPQNFTVPSFVTKVTVTVDGAQGGGMVGKGGMGSVAGALGGQTTLDAPVTPGDVLTVIVGGQGGHILRVDPGTTGGAGGYGGGAAGGGSGGQIPGTGGGGGSFVFFAGGGLMASAGGGGGRGVTAAGGTGGGGPAQFVGGTGGDGSDSAAGGMPGTGAADGLGGAGTSAGASHGSDGSGTINGPNNPLPVGGAGGSGGYGGGGGGGGSYSGGGGGSDNNASADASSGAGGGGGSSYVGIGTTNQSGSAGVVSGNGSVTIVYSKGATQTATVVGPTSITTTVTSTVAGAVAPTGSVAFAVDSEGVGSAPLVDGVATLAYTIPTGGLRHIDVTYAGDDNYLGSSGSTTRNDPSITATLHSAKPASRFHWYRRPVTVTFHCTATTGAVTACPKPATLSRNAAHQTLSGTVTAADGGSATVKVAGINIDQVKPKVAIHGPKAGVVYKHKPPKARCVAHDALSGIAKCVIHRDIAARNILITATATDRAGNVARVRMRLHLA